MLEERGQMLVDQIAGVFNAMPVDHSEAVTVLVFLLANALYDGTMDKELNEDLEADVCELLRSAYKYIVVNDQPTH